MQEQKREEQKGRKERNKTKTVGDTPLLWMKSDQSFIITNVITIRPLLPDIHGTGMYVHAPTGTHDHDHDHD